jgi:hypothetical protein
MTQQIAFEPVPGSVLFAFFGLVVRSHGQ